MKPRLLLTSTALLLAVFAGASRGTAQPKRCMDEMKRLCPDVTPGKGAIVKCLRPHHDELSPDCQKALEQGERRKKALAARQRQVQTARAAVTPTPRSAKE